MIGKNASASVTSPLLTRLYEYDHRELASTVAYDNNRFILEIALQQDEGNPLATGVTAAIEDIQPDGSFTSNSYFRYWHGWQLITNACLSIGSIDVVSAVVFVLTIIAGVGYLVLLCGYVGRTQACVFGVVAFQGTNFALAFHSDLTLGISFWINVAFAALLLAWGGSAYAWFRLSVRERSWIKGTSFAAHDSPCCRSCLVFP